MVFSETWFESDNCSSIQSYDDYHTVRQNKKGGGVSIYVRNKYKSSKLNNLSGIYSTFEACTVILKVNESFEIYIVCLYRPPDSSLNQFFFDFSDYLSNNFSDLSNVIFLGDFNIDLSPNNLPGNELSNLFQCYLYDPLINKPTRVYNLSQSIIDHAWSNMNLQFNSYVLETDISDHYTVALNFKINLSKKFVMKKFRVHSENALNNLVNEFNIYAMNENLYSGLDFEENLEQLVNKINRLYDEHCPIMTKNMSENRILKPWLNNHIISLIRFNHYLYNEYKNGCIPFNIYDGFMGSL